MARRRHRRKGKGSRSAQPNIMHPDAAGLDIGSTEVYVAVDPKRDPDPIRNFPTFTDACTPWPTGSRSAR